MIEVITTLHPFIRGTGGRAALRVAVLPIVAALAALVGCGDDEPDAYGSFEADEVVVSAEVAGQLVRFDAGEGERLARGAEVGLIDTVQLGLQVAELRAQQSASDAQVGEAIARTGALEAELPAAERELARTRRLFADEAATRQQLDQASVRVDVLRAQIRAARQQATAVREQAGATGARLAQLDDRLERSRIRNPIAGTVLTSYGRVGELVQPGQPLYSIASLDTLDLRAYVDGSQLSSVRLGQPVQVRVDGADGLVTLPGVLTWVSASAEFTPTPIQTRDERASMVYAITVRVPNPDGALKVGMPGEVVLDAGSDRAGGR